MAEEDMDYKAMQHILRCDGRREVYAFLNGYKETAFTEFIQWKLDLAQFLVAREKDYESSGRGDFPQHH